MQKANRYSSIIDRIFFAHYRKGTKGFEFSREELVRAAAKLEIALPKNLGDIIYSFRYRASLPKSILSRAPRGKEWIIRPAGTGKYRFETCTLSSITPTPQMVQTKVPDATPGIIEMHALNDEQALLARLRYNRLIDIFSGVACYSLQSHLRTAVPKLGQVETDEVYIGIDRRGAQYIFPVQAKGAKDKLNVVQIEQDFAMCRYKFPDLICKPVAAQFAAGDLIVLFGFESGENGVAITAERHYRLVPYEQVKSEDLRSYRERIDPA